MVREPQGVVPVALNQTIEAEFEETTEVVPHRSWKQKLANASRAMGKLPQVECPTTHYFSPGIYIREMFLPAGTIAIGKIHKHAHMNILLKGRLALVGENGDRTELVAPMTFASPAGTQKAVHVLEDTILQNVHATNERDLESLEAQLIVSDPSYQTFDRTEERKAIADAARAESALQLEHN